MTVPAPREPEPTPVTGGPRGHLRGHHIFWSLISGLIIVGVAITAGWVIARPYGQDEWADVIRSAVLAAGAVAAVPAGYVAYRKQQTTEAERHEAIDKEQRRRDELVEANTRADAKDYRDRYAAASGQLGSDKAAIRLAGVYALAQLADEWGRTEPDQRQVCINVLCAYLRMPWPPPTATTPSWPTPSVARRPAEHTSAPPAPEPQSEPREMAEETQVRATILNVVAEHVQQDHDPATAWWSNNFDFIGADRLPRCLFKRARFDGTFNASGATFSQFASFENTTFSQDVSFENTTFSQPVSFENTTFSRPVFFLGTTFSQTALFRGTTFSLHARFDRATFSQAAKFDGAVFHKVATFEHARFSVMPDFRSAMRRAQAMVFGFVIRPDGTMDPATSAPRPLARALFPQGRPST